MIHAVLLRNIKVYEGMHFIPVSGDHCDRYAVYVGKNGVGKSSILEALDSFFNARAWNINSRSKSTEAFVAVLLTVTKADIPNAQVPVFQYVHDYFWSIDESANPNIAKTPALMGLLKHRDALKSQVDPASEFLLLIGSTFGTPKEAFFSTFDGHLRKGLKASNLSEQDLASLKGTVLNSISYVYVPVQTPLDDLLRLHGREIQGLLRKDVATEIDKLLNQKDIKVGAKKSSVVDLVNSDLSSFLDEVNSRIAQIDSDYTFERPPNFKKRVTSADIRDRIVQAFFSIRTLRKGNRDISQLSSGEQRIAMVDMVTAFLSDDKDRTLKDVVFAVDEPEASMHLSNCFRQFSRLAEVANHYGHQVLVTTHWYGFVPMCQRGILHHVATSPSPFFTSYALTSVLEQRGDFPHDVELKSMFDFVASLIDMMKTEGGSWLICEGSDDANYLSYFLGQDVQNLHIFPVGGCTNVVKIYTYLYQPLNEKIEAGYVDGKVLCLIDTDRNQVPFDMPSDSSKGHLSIRRLQLDGDEVKLMRLGKGGVYHETLMEDVVDSTAFYTAVAAVVARMGDSTVQSAFSRMKPSEKAGYAKMNHGMEFLEPVTFSQNTPDDTKTIRDFLSRLSVKYEVSLEYTASEAMHAPVWVRNVVDLLS